MRGSRESSPPGKKARAGPLRARPVAPCCCRPRPPLPAAPAAAPPALPAAPPAGPGCRPQGWPAPRCTRSGSARPPAQEASNVAISKAGWVRHATVASGAVHSRAAVLGRPGMAGARAG